MDNEIIKGNPHVVASLERLTAGPKDVRHTDDTWGNSYHWFTLERPEQITDAAKILHAAHARLAIIAAYNHKGTEQKRLGNACYEFVLDGVVYGITIHMDPEHPAVPSITPLFANADWHEREMIELYGIKVIGQPNPRRLFLDEELDQGLLGQLAPLSVMMNGASSTDLWERILADKGARS